MTAWQPDHKDLTPNELKRQLGMMQVRLEDRDIELLQRSQLLDLTQSDLKRQETELKQVIIELTQLKVELGITKEKLERNKKTLKSKVLGVAVSIIFLTSTYLFNLGNSMITSKPPDTNGNLLLVFAGILYLISAVITIFML